MDLSFSHEEEAFRAEVRAFIADAKPLLPRALGEPQSAMRTRDDYLAWHKLLYKKGWIAPLWPQANMAAPAGASRSAISSTRRCAAAEMPTILALRPRHGGAGDLSPSAMTSRRRNSCRAFCRARIGGARAIPSRARAPISRVCALRAVREGDHYIVNGQKTWTTLAQYADWIFCLVRTDPDVKQQEGITFLLIDMKSPGITVKPIIVLDGAQEVNEVFFDNVKVPVENRVGEENKGWTYAKFLLVNERSGIAGVARSKQRGRAAEGNRARRDGRTARR